MQKSLRPPVVYMEARRHGHPERVPVSPHPRPDVHPQDVHDVRPAVTGGDSEAPHARSLKWIYLLLLLSLTNNIYYYN